VFEDQEVEYWEVPASKTHIAKMLLAKSPAVRISPESFEWSQLTTSGVVQEELGIRGFREAADCQVYLIRALYVDGVSGGFRVCYYPDADDGPGIVVDYVTNHLERSVSVCVRQEKMRKSAVIVQLPRRPVKVFLCCR